MQFLRHVKNKQTNLYSRKQNTFLSDQSHLGACWCSSATTSARSISTSSLFLLKDHRLHLKKCLSPLPGLKWANAVAFKAATAVWLHIFVPFLVYNFKGQPFNRDKLPVWYIYLLHLLCTANGMAMCRQQGTEDSQLASVGCGCVFGAVWNGTPPFFHHVHFYETCLRSSHTMAAVPSTHVSQVFAVFAPLHVDSSSVLPYITAFISFSTLSLSTPLLLSAWQSAVGPRLLAVSKSVT